MRALTSFLFLMAIAAALPGQNEPGDLLVGTTAPAAVQRVDAVTLRVSTLFQGVSTIATIYGLTMDADNRQVLFAMTADFYGHPRTTGGIWRVDPATAAVTTVLQDPVLFYKSRQILVNQDGDYVIASKSRHDALLEVNRTTLAVTTILAARAFGQPVEWRGGLAVDIDTGHYLLLDRDPAAPTSLQYPFLLVTGSGAVTTLARLPVQPRFAFAQDIPTGDFFAGFDVDVPAMQSGLLRITRAGVVTTVISGSVGGTRHGYRVLVADRACPPHRRLLSSYVHHIFSTDLTSFTVTSVAVVLGSPRASAILHARHVQTLKTGRRTWDIRLSYPMFPGKPYALALGVSGVRPGIRLADGRRVSLNPDVFTVLSVYNLLAPFFAPGPGRLDARTGEARGRLDVSGLPALGLPVWIQALVIDPAAPSGIAVVEDPRVIRL